MTFPAVEFTDLTKVYEMGAERVHALRGVSARFETGSFWAIMGASGSGKSTLLSILGCLDRPTSGTYRLGGEDVSTLGDDALAQADVNRDGDITIPDATTIQRYLIKILYSL